MRVTTKATHRSPLKIPRDMWKEKGAIPGSSLGMAGFPLHRFWRKGRYYENDFAFQMGTTEGESIYFPIGSYWVCANTEEKPVCADSTHPDADITGVHVTLLGLHPQTNRPVQVEFFPHAQTGLNEQFSVVENEMLILALASTGLVL